MNKIKEIIAKHQLICFFICTYIFTWLLILPVIITGNEQKYGVLAILGLFGPALVNIYISKKLSTETKDDQKLKRIITFLVVFVIGTIVFTLNVSLNSKIQSPFAIAIFSIISLLPAFIISSAYSKSKSVSLSLISLVRPKGKFKYYLFAFAFAPVIKLVSLPLSNFLGLKLLSEPEPPGGLMPLVIFIIVTFAWGFLFTGGLNEEVGWSGFALPRLQKRFNPFIASIVLWFFWILWHIPLQVSGFWNAELNSFIRAIIGSFFCKVYSYLGFQ